MSERVLSGAPASPGLAIGHARVLSHPSEVPARDPGPTREPAAEADHACEALRLAAAELERIAASLRDDGRPDDAEIVETGALMAADPLLDAAVTAAVMERRPLGRRRPHRGHRGARGRHRVAAGRTAGGAGRRCALARPPRGAHRRGRV